MVVETCDVLVLGAGPAGIAAARSLREQGQKSVIVLEARSRVGGRAFTSDSLGVNVPLDHGAKWIHGNCPENRMIQLWRQELDPSLLVDVDDDDATKKEGKTPPPFDTPDADTEYEISSKLPTANMTKIILQTPEKNIISKEPSLLAKKVAKQAFRDIIQSTMNNNAKDQTKEMEGASLLDVLLLSHTSAQPEEEQEKHKAFADACRNQLLLEHEGVKQALQNIPSKQEQDLFRQEVMALFAIEIYTFFESWEGAPIHEISAQYGLEGTCLPGGNAVVPFGYGALVQKLAQPLLLIEEEKEKKGHSMIRLGHQVVSVTTTTDNIKVQCQLVEDGDKIQEFSASACIVALPLGVLRAAIQENGTTSNNNSPPFFDPELPAPLQHSIQSLGITARNKIEMLFPFRWWPETIGRITIACTHLQQSPTFHPFTTFIVESAELPNTAKDENDTTPNILVCYVAGDFARETEPKTNAEIQEEVMTVLRQANFDSNNQQEIPDPSAIYVTRWVQDPFSRGSWTFYGKGSTPADVRMFRENTECHARGLFFAGEHTCSGTIPGDDMGCVHGAWLSGELAAKAAIKSLSS